MFLAGERAGARPQNVHNEVTVRRLLIAVRLSEDGAEKESERCERVHFCRRHSKHGPAHDLGLVVLLHVVLEPFGAEVASAVVNAAFGLERDFEVLDGEVEAPFARRVEHEFPDHDEARLAVERLRQVGQRGEGFLSSPSHGREVSVAQSRSSTMARSESNVLPSLMYLRASSPQRSMASSSRSSRA